MKKIESLSLLTDLYQLTMSYGYFKNNMHNKTAVFNLFYRKNPFNGNYAISCGLRSAIDYIQNFKFIKSDIDYLRTLTGNDNKALFSEDFLEYLSQLKFEGDIDGVEEGRIVFPHEPMLRIKAPIILGQLLETPLLNIMNFQTLIATKTNRVCLAAQGDTVLEFGLRRAQGVDGAISATYASMIGGAHATSNVLAGKLFGMGVKGTHAHSWVMSFDQELDAFNAYADSLPNNCIFLVDTYNTKQGVTNAIEVAKSLREKGHEVLGIRLDSGDMAKLSIMAREMLDKAGFEGAKIVASNDLDEYRIHELKSKGAKIDVWGVGTKLVTAYDQPALGGVYKLAAIKEDDNWIYKVKKSEELIKVSNPGILNIKRYLKDGKYSLDVMINEEEQASDRCVDMTNENLTALDEQESFELLLVPIFREGKYIYKQPTIEESIAKKDKDFNLLPDHLKGFSSSEPYPVCLDESLHKLKKKLLDNI